MLSSTGDLQSTMDHHKLPSDGPIDLSPRSKQVPAISVDAIMADQSKSTSPFTSPLLLVSSAMPTSLSAPSVVTPISPVSSTMMPSVPFSAIYPPPSHRPLVDLTASAASLIQQKLLQFSLNAASTSPSSLSSHSSASSASSAYFSSSPTSSTKSWSHLDEIMMNGVTRTVAGEAKLASQLPAMVSSQPDPSVVTHSVSHLLSHDSTPFTYGDNGVVVLNKSNVIKFGMRKEPSLVQGKPLDLHTQPKQSSLSALPDIKPILATVTSSNPSGGAILPLPLTSAITSTTNSFGTGSKPLPNGTFNQNGIPTVPRRRGRPPGSTNKKKKLQQQLAQQQQQLICAMSLMPNNGGPLNPAAFAGHPFITSAGLLAPTMNSADHLNHQLSCSQFAAAFAAVSAQTVTGLKPSGSGRKPRGESRKCRKVYGMDNRQLWCTQCKWKKACSRFTE